MLSKILSSQPKLEPSRTGKIAVVLLNFGGPQNLSETKSFLFNLFNDSAIIRLPQPLRFMLATLISNRRAKKLRNIYQQIGNKSPITDITVAQANLLEKELSFFGDYKIFVAMRYNKPFAADILPDLISYNPDQIILLPLYPQFSTTTTLSSVAAFLKEYKKYDFSATLKVICCYPEDQNFAQSHSSLIKQAIEQSSLKLDKVRILFSAHGLPQSIINDGDPYAFQIVKSVKAITQNLEESLQIKHAQLDYVICYQSKVGRMEWTKPSLDFELRKAALDNKEVVIVPISFTSEHSETLYELDIEYKHIAQKLGITNYVRINALNLNTYFIKSLVEICKKSSASKGNIFNGCNPYRICPKSFKQCINYNECQTKLSSI